MSVRCLQTNSRTLSRVFRETVTALTLLGFLVLDVPVPLAVLADDASRTQVTSCCADRLSAEQRTQPACGCSVKMQKSGTCCCQGRSNCGRSKLRDDDDRGVYFSSCDCGGPQTQFLMGTQPRLKPESHKVIGTPSVELLPPAPGSKLESIRFEPETPPPRLRLRFSV